jgi:all-trans-retinol 13,14-reductase
VRTRSSRNNHEDRFRREPDREERAERAGALMSRIDRFRSLDAGEAWDAVVIGAGLGGLTTAAILAAKGKKVLVLDQHYVAGGNATMFKRPGYIFDVGVHYIGDCTKAGQIPRVLAEAGVELDFLPMDPDGFDTLCFADGTRFAYPKGVEAFEARLLEMFPAERKGIRKWTRFLRQVWRLMVCENQPLKLLRALPFSMFAVRHLNSTLEQVLDACTQDARLRAVLIGPHMDHAVAPSRVSALLHAGLVMHYLVDGAFYPAGGGQAMSDALVEAIEKGGGRVLLLSKAERIVVEDGRAAGVVFTNKHLGRVTVRAPIVVSNADLKATYQRLLPEHAVPAAVQEKVQSYEMAPGIAILYLGVKQEALGKEGTLNTNYWLFPSLDMEQDYAALAANQFAASPSVYVTLSSNKDPGQKVSPDGVMKLQVMALAPSDPKVWGLAGDEAYRKSPEYKAKKQELRDRLLAQVRSVFPNLEGGIVYEEMATPLTHARYTLSTGGTPYGIAATTKQFDQKRPGAQTHLPGLLLAGASTRNAHGVVGACLSGREAARAALKQLARLPQPRRQLAPVAHPVPATVGNG